MKIAKSDNDYHIYPKQIIEVNAIPSGNLLDIGGGGEGVIAQIGHNRVTAVDQRQDEIDEAKSNAPEAKWVCADARKLDFNNNYFDNATAFFSGMYMTEEVQEDVFKEVSRLIVRGGKFWIWDAVISYEKGPFIIYLEIHIPNGKIINTGYGKRTVDRDRNPNDVIRLLNNAGFDSNIIEENEFCFSIQATKR